MSTSIQPNAPFRADIVGSFLRPQAVKDARVAYAAGTLDAAGLKAVEDEAIRDLVDKQKSAGLQFVVMAHGFEHLDGCGFLARCKADPTVKQFLHIRGQFDHVGIGEEL